MYIYNVIIKYIVVYIDTINTFQKKIINYPLKKIVPCIVIDSKRKCIVYAPSEPS